MLRIFTEGRPRLADTKETGGILSSSPSTSPATPAGDIAQRMIHPRKSHTKITFRDYDEKGRVTCKFVCTFYWATQFHAVREVLLSPSRLKFDDTEESPEMSIDTEQSYIENLPPPIRGPHQEESLAQLSCVQVMLRYREHLSV